MKNSKLISHAMIACKTTVLLHGEMSAVAAVQGNTNASSAAYTLQLGVSASNNPKLLCQSMLVSNATVVCKYGTLLQIAIQT
jgi:hypothetical protein